MDDNCIVGLSRYDALLLNEMSEKLSEMSNQLDPIVDALWGRANATHGLSDKNDLVAINDMMSNIESCIGDAIVYIDRLLESYLLKEREKEE
jgi:hypothetical protein|nr:MAG TPA: hypothetical protein [Caudoviricetes sp.]